MIARPHPQRLECTEADVLLTEGHCPDGHGRLTYMAVQPEQLPPTGSPTIGYCPTCSAGYVAWHDDPELTDRALAELGKPPLPPPWGKAGGAHQAGATPPDQWARA